MNKLIGASALVLGFAVTSAYAGVGSTGGEGASATAAELAIATQVDLNSRNTVNTNSNNDSHNYTDSGTHVKVGDVTLTYETNQAVSTAALSNVSTFNIATQVGAFGGTKFITTAKMGDCADSNWSGVNQVNVVAGLDNVSQMNQQVSANIRTLNNH